jgi:hypothetical protein
VYPRLRSLIAAGACALALVVAAAACGGGGSSSSGPPQTVPGPGFRFNAPGDWKVRRQGSEVSAAPKPTATELVSVSKFPLLKPYSPLLFAKVTKELDKDSGELAARLGGSVKTRSTTTVAGERVRQYLLTYPQDAKDPTKGTFGGRLTYVLRGKTEYELFCRWDEKDSEPGYCARLTRSFRPV